ncbi:MAG: helix-turn-helix transcriptional regulator [Ignavibacteriaceae bacterium]|jgi:transcriptional regulator with XRE-family HTH domain|nr:helix-turn-helix transcriptional regulator [Ignavibacteriaceae bacterium]
MTLGQNITSLRKAKKLSQNDLGKLAGTSGDLIGRYERDEVKPSIDVAVKIANALEVSLDYLVGSTDLLLDKGILKKIKEIQLLDNENKNHLYALMDAFLRDYKAKQAYQ